MSILRRALQGAGLMALALVITTPSSFLARWQPQWLEIGEWQGTLWRGQIRDIRLKGQPFLDTLAWDWKLSHLLLLTARVDLNTQWHGQSGHAELAAGFSSLELRQTQLLLPIEPLTRFNPKLDDYRPAGDLQLQTASFRVEDGRGQGVIDGEWQDARTGWTGDTLLGRYRLYLRAVSKGYAFRVETLEGPLLLAGDSTGDPKQGWNLGVSVKLPPTGMPGLEPLLSRLEAAPDGRYILRYSFR